jgi:regulator of nucleoside diphosphate kinase
MMKTDGFEKPSITLSISDSERLAALANAARNQLPDLAAELVDEIGRAHVLAPGEQPRHCVCMNCEVGFRDDTTGKSRTVTLVYPEDADISQSKISVMTPVGIALIGLPVGSSIAWQTPGGEMRRLTVLSVGEPSLDVPGKMNALG